MLASVHVIMLELMSPSWVLVQVHISLFQRIISSSLQRFVCWMFSFFFQFPLISLVTHTFVWIKMLHLFLFWKPYFCSVHIKVLLFCDFLLRKLLFKINKFCGLAAEFVVFPWHSRQIAELYSTQPRCIYLFDVLEGWSFSAGFFVSDFSIISYQLVIRFLKPPFFLLCYSHSHWRGW